MKVKDLIEELQRMPAHCEVLVQTSNDTATVDKVVRHQEMFGYEHVVILDGDSI